LEVQSWSILEETGGFSMLTPEGNIQIYPNISLVNICDIITHDISIHPDFEWLFIHMETTKKNSAK